MGDRLKGKNAVVTGSGRGIGREIALAMAAEGANVVVNDPGVARDGKGSDTKPVDEVVAEIRKRGGTAAVNYDSVTDFAGAERIIQTCLDSFGRIDILINNAGFLRDRMIFNMALEEWGAIIDVMLNGTFNCTRHAAPLMRKQRGGRIINITSDAWRGTVGHANYGAAKAGIVGFTRAVAREMGKYGVTCNAVAPMAATRMSLDDDVKQGLRKRLEAGLISKEAYDTALATPGPEGVPPLIVYLASDEAANINGRTFHSDAERISIYSEPVEERVIHWDYRNKGIITVDKLADLVPKELVVDYVNPAPPEPPKDK